MDDNRNGSEEEAEEEAGAEEGHGWPPREWVRGIGHRQTQTDTDRNFWDLLFHGVGLVGRGLVEVGSVAVWSRRGGEFSGVAAGGVLALVEELGEGGGRGRRRW